MSIQSANTHIPDRSRESLVLIGGGGHALVVEEAARALHLHLAGFLDDSHASRLSNQPEAIHHLGNLAHLEIIAGRRWVLALGSLTLRARLLDTLETLGTLDAALSLIHPSAFVSPSAEIGAGVYIAPGAIVQSHAIIQDHAIINTGAIVEHECVVGFNAHIAPGAILAGRARIDPNTLVGVGARVLPQVSVGAGCVIGAGAVVTRGVPDGLTVVGMPARTVVG